jgi:hypothetical protein
MAELTKTYHENIQAKDLYQFNNDAKRKYAEQQTLQSILPQQKLRNPESSPLHSGITQKDVETALKKSKMWLRTWLRRMPKRVMENTTKELRISEKTAETSLQHCKDLNHNLPRHPIPWHRPQPKLHRRLDVPNI